VLDIRALQKPDITFWSAWDANELSGCGALKQPGSNAGEIKSIRTASAHLRMGVAAQLLQHIIVEARNRG
jgi:putative acetyltransferase